MWKDDAKALCRNATITSTDAIVRSKSRRWKGSCNEARDFGRPLLQRRIALQIRERANEGIARILHRNTFKTGWSIPVIDLFEPRHEARKTILSAS